MDVVFAAFFVYGPLTLLGIALNGASAVFVLRTGRIPDRLLVLTATVLVALFSIGVFFAVMFRLDSRDWVHLFWSAQIPLVGLFLGSGVLLCQTWCEGEAGSRDRPTCIWNGAAVFLVMAATLGLAPLLLQAVLPEDHPSPRATGAPVRGLVELAAWGLGGPRPAALDPITPEEVAKGLGHLPRDLSVPMGLTLIAAWLWIGFSLLAVSGRLIRARGARLCYFLLGPIALGMLNTFLLPGTSPRGFDPQIFSPDGSRDTGIWTSEPELLSSYGPVLLAALACAAALCLFLVRERGGRRAQRVDRKEAWD